MAKKGADSGTSSGKTDGYGLTVAERLVSSAIAQNLIDGFEPKTLRGGAPREYRRSIR